MSRWAAALLSPILIPQAAWVIARAQRLPEASGPREGRFGHGPLLRVLIIGDSSAAGVGAETQDHALAGQLTRRLAETHEVSWRLIAKTGATRASTLAHLRMVSPSHYDVVILIHGVNDSTRLVPPARFLNDTRETLALLNSHWGAPKVFVCAIPPLGHFPLLPRPLRNVLGRHAKRLDRSLQALVDQAHVPFDMPLDTAMMASDGFHPGPKIYSLWAERLAQRIKNG